MSQKTIVNSWNEWDPLKHVIIGRANDCHIPPEEPALDAKVPEDSDMRGQYLTDFEAEVGDAFFIPWKHGVVAD